MNERDVPISLTIVAVLYLLTGIGAVLGMLVHLAQGSLFLDFGALGIPIFFGLRAFSTGWRTCALVFTWFGLILAPVVIVAGLTMRSPVPLKFFGFQIAWISPIWMSILGVFSFLLIVWEYRVLTRPDVRALFYPAGAL